MVISATPETVEHTVPEQAGSSAAAGRGRPGPAGRGHEDPLARALRRAADQLLSRQDAAGWWKFDLESNTTMDAEDLLLREFLGIRTASVTAASALFIRGRQLPDGSWPQYFQGPGDLSVTVESYIALRLAGDEISAPHLERAAAWIRRNGGIPATRVFTRIWLALFGWWRWEDLPVLPPEIMLLPARAPLSIYSFGSWARQTIVPLTVVFALRPVRPAPFDLAELSVAGEASKRPASGENGTGAGARRRRGPVRIGWKEVFRRVDAGLHRYHHHPIGPLRRHALRVAEQWIIARQEADGCFGGIQPPAVYSIIALHLLGYDLAHPVLKAAFAALDAYTVALPDGSRMVEASQSPVWDTALAVNALVEAGAVTGTEPDDPALVRAADWLLGQEIRDRRGDWRVNHPDLPAGGWAFEFENDTYPDTDDTAEVLLALRHVRHPDPAQIDAATARTVTWLFGLQSRDGGWGAYDSDNTSTLVYEIPFGDFGALTDPPSADVTAHVVEILAEAGFAQDARTRRGVAWLLRHQEADGSWYGRWGVNHIYGTGSVLPALVAAGVEPTHPAVRRAADWLLSRQNVDGGWGEDLRSYSDPRWRGQGASTASQTAWAMLGLLAAGPRPEVAAALARAAHWLADHQRPDGSWDEDQFTGTGFPGDFYLNYHGYRLIWPVLALGRYLRTNPSRSRSVPARDA
ncbi:squalene-hopene/tetraprenyl-beta-curcumene cyclase [Frankia sp. EI5c]|uniref:squalene--hopene cyclase n=1 Tax=Frankia sp. EI5c TaxID=683316 RepID=UPI0007C213D6|nr:squalene--hopene cyclase [Frankia sp. EI5c]OAA26387.1 squalene-hopene/tetraprenyl-beta-curcumene cyclase [Frankia sp. EI5c]